MVQGANAYLKFRPKVDISLISAVIFSLFGATGDEPIMQFRYPEDTDLIDGIIYIGFTQEQTMTLYEASGGAVEMEIQINLGDKTAVKPCTQRIQIRRSRETEIIEGNQPDYKLPDQVIDLETGTVVLLRGFSPIVNVEDIDGGYRVTITDEEGEKFFEVMDGKTGLAELSIPITYSELKSQRDSGSLVRGLFYRITDYITTTVQPNTQSAGHQFDIIVRALTETELDEEAKAVRHDGDEYFANNNLSGWRLWYTLDNDVNRSAWADAENGKGVIFRMIDENGNDCPYDFKNIMMRNPLDTADENYYYTFDGNGTDHSLNGNLCFNNVINKYISTAQEINNIIFTNAKGLEVDNNFFDVKCYNNVFTKAQRNNRFGRECYGNNFLGYNYTNTFDTKFRNNTVGAESQSMQFGQGATGNVIGGNTYYCRFGNYFRYNHTCRYMYYSEFGHYVQYCNFGESAEAPDQYMRFLTFENNVQYVNLCKADKTTKTYMENIRICSGTVGKSASRIRIEVPELAQKYAITFANNSSGELKKYCDADNLLTEDVKNGLVNDVIAALPVYNGEVVTE